MIDLRTVQFYQIPMISFIAFINLEHFVSCFKSLCKIYNSLKINGTAFIVVPNMNYYTKDSIVEYFIDTHTFELTNNVLVNLFNKIGFKILKKDEKSDITYYLQKIRR